MINEFNYALSLANTLYNVEGKIEDLEEIGLIGWNLIGNKMCKLYKYTENLDPDTLSLILPCNFVAIESVNYSYEDWKYTTNTHPNGDYNSQFVENYIETRKVYHNPLYAGGRYAKYEKVGDKLFFDKDYGKINLLYHGIFLGEEGLPQITESEALAIACYIAYVKLFKEGIATRNNNTIQIAQLMQADWLKKCDAARVPDHIDQNTINDVLEVKSSWDRKIFNKSYKPVK